MIEPEKLNRWVERARRGDVDSWHKLVDEFQALVYSIPRRMSLGDADADDVFQATFLALFRNLDRIEDPRTLPRWLAITASRECYRIKRLQSRSIASESLDEMLADEDQAVEKEAERAQASEMLHHGLQTLGGRCRDLLEALYIEELRYEEIAETLKMPVGAIGPTRARCLEKLRKIVQASGWD